MSEAPDPLETELGALRPHGPSPELRLRVAERLKRPPVRRWWIGGIALALVLAAVGGLVVVAPWRKDADPPAPPVVVPTPPTATEPESLSPTLADYQRALARSPEDLDALLDRSAATGPNSESDLMSVGTFSRSGATLDALIGDN